MHLLDTDTLTYLHSGHPEVIKRLQQLSDSDVCTTIVTKIEILQGRYDFLLKAADAAQIVKAQRWLDRSEELLLQIRVIRFDDRAAEQFEQIVQTPGLRKLGRPDLLIASIARAHRATLVTRNLRHFRQIPGLQLDNWVD